MTAAEASKNLGEITDALDAIMVRVHALERFNRFTDADKAFAILEGSRENVDSMKFNTYELRKLIPVDSP